METRADEPTSDVGQSRSSVAFDGLSGFDPDASLATDQVELMVTAWKRGERPTAEDFLTSQPDLGDEATIRLIFEEYCLRREAGMEVDSTEITRRFPQWRAELQILFECHRMMDPGSLTVLLPETGEELAEFRLLAQLGQGVSGRVFLASQPSLADRPVVLKVTPRGRDEHLSLARLQHMNIVPLHSAQVLQDRHLQVLCMPFLGGASLAQVLELLRDQPPALRTGSQLIEALDTLQASLPVSLPVRGPFRQYIAGSDYVEAICWIGVCLADGLQYAHDRHFVHMDIKPSNVLLAGDGQPMLLDFHLAREPINPGDPAPTWMGGTPDYMAPEQADALVAVREGRPIRSAVDGRADVFALGLLLHEALGGAGPKAKCSQRLPTHLCNPRVSVGLSDIIDHCLCPDPRERYPDAAALATDLRRHLDGLPLQGVPNRNMRERWSKWRKRRPHSLISSAIVLVSVMTALAAIVLLWAEYHQRVREVESALTEGRANIDRQQYGDATRALKHGLAVAEYLPGASPMRRELRDEIERAQRDGKAADLHRIAELVRFRYGIDPPPLEEARALIDRGRDIWHARHLLLRSIAGRREPDVERTIRNDLLDFVLVWASLRVHSATVTDADAARREALAVLDEATDVLGPSPTIERERRAYSLETANRLRGPQIRPQSAWEHYNMGRSHLRSGEIALAADQFQLGLLQRPQDFWLNFYQGLCAYRLKRFEEAATAFRVCIALAPDSGECFFNRALALSALGRGEDAMADYTRALQRNSSLTSAALNRGILHLKAGRQAEAASDLRQALASATSRKDLGMIHYNLALVDLARGDRPSALANLDQAAHLGHEDARILSDRIQNTAQDKTAAIKQR